MALPYSEWLKEAEDLQEGHSRRVQHLCGEGNTLRIEHNSEGYRCWCWRCNAGGFKEHGRRSLDQLLKGWAASDEILRGKVYLPSDITLDAMPNDALLWLARGGITNAIANRYGIGYSPSFSRVFIPVYNGDKLVYWQARAVHLDQTPKYINPAVDKRSIRFTSHTTGVSSSVVVTEDILSAIRVGESTAQDLCGCSILGTSASTTDLAYLNGFKKIIAWFDPDAAGIKATNTLRKQLGMFGRDIVCIKSDVDPKIYSRHEIEEIIWQALT